MEARGTGASKGEGRGGARGEGRKEAGKGEKEASRKEIQKQKENLLRVQTQAGTIQPFGMGNLGASKRAMGGPKNGRN